MSQRGKNEEEREGEKMRFRTAMTQVLSEHLMKLASAQGASTLG